MRRLRRRARDDDRGAVAVLVAVLLGGGVLLGMGALVIDVGLVAHEREQLQGGADAAAWAVGESCMRTPATCATQDALAQRQADGNSRDGTSAAALTLCTNSCGAESRARNTPCPPLPAALESPFAEVRTTTRDQQGGTLVPPVLAQALAGGYAGTAVEACAQVAWGAPASGVVLPIGIAHCEWLDATSGGTVFSGTGSRTVQSGGGTVTSCGADVPPGWFPTTGYNSFAPDDGCTLTVTVGDAMERPLLADECTAALDEAMTSGESVLVPITDAMQAGVPERFRVAGLAAFRVTGYRAGLLTGGSGPLCGAGFCVRGWFENRFVPVNGVLPGSGQSYGATYITRIG